MHVLLFPEPAGQDAVRRILLTAVLRHNLKALPNRRSGD